MNSWQSFLALASLSFGAGGFGALLGLGGGVIIVRALTLQLGIGGARRDGSCWWWCR